MQERMKRAVLVRPGEIRIEEVEVPTPAEGEVLLRVGAALTCGTDLKTYRRGHPLIPLPAPLGHEYAGTVARAGRGAIFGEGARIAGTPTAPCGDCGPCGRGEGNLCDRIPGGLLLGSFGEFLLIPERIVRQNVHEIPDDLPFEVAALLDPLSCVVHGQRRVGDLRGRSVAILGVGAVGLMHLQLARRAGAQEVTAVDTGEDRLDRARDLGAEVVVDFRSDDPMPSPDVVVECAGTTGAWESAVAMVRKGGRVLLFGGCPGGSRAAIDTEKVHYGEVTLVGAFHATPEDVREAHRLLVSREIEGEILISGRIPLEDLEDGLGKMSRREALKLAVLPAGDHP
jgi:L-iditol 2-dehydrogenase